MAPRTIERQRAARAKPAGDTRRKATRRAKTLGIGSLTSLLSSALSLAGYGIDIRVTVLRVVLRNLREVLS